VVSPLGRKFTKAYVEYQNQLREEFLNEEKKDNIGFELVRQNKKPKIRHRSRDDYYS
jgi:hypothetical protein